jgi:hypothetical protein
MRIFPFVERVSFACLLACSPAVFAQAQQPALSFDQLLSRVEANTEEYRSTVPSFVCDEHITSQEIHDGKLKHETTVDAIFSVTRSTRQTGVLDESREVKAIDNKPSAKKKVNMPLAFSGGFSGALTKFLSVGHDQCFKYQPDAPNSSRQDEVGFTFAARDDVSTQPSCATIKPGTGGRVLVDTATMQVTHIERTVPNPIAADHSVFGTASVDYAAVTLNGNTFWLPITITAFTTETPKTNGFRFAAHYSNYHRFGATSTIIPLAPDAESKSQPK